VGVKPQRRKREKKGGKKSAKFGLGSKEKQHLRNGCFKQKPTAEKIREDKIEKINLLFLKRQEVYRVFEGPSKACLQAMRRGACLPIWSQVVSILRYHRRSSASYRRHRPELVVAARCSSRPIFCDPERGKWGRPTLVKAVERSSEEASWRSYAGCGSQQKRTARLTVNSSMAGKALAALVLVTEATSGRQGWQH